jgi:hypothetical protein
MRHNTFSRDHNHKPANASPPVASADANTGGVDDAPSRDEVERRAYFTYVNQGSLQGHEVQHWLDAEAQLLAERNRTRVHGFHNRT